jgi:SAM-dependent methyltransferase
MSMANNHNSYRSSHTAPKAVSNYSDIYSGFKKSGRVADRFSYARWQIEREEINKYISREFGGGQTDKSYLDFACGTGRLLALLESHFALSIGVDISQEMLNVAATVCDKSELVCADLTNECTTFDNQFHLITAFRFFLRAEPELRLTVFKKIYELLTQDGTFIFNVHDSRYSLNWPLYFYSDFTGKESPVPGEFCLEARPSFSDEEVKDSLESIGFTVERITHIGIVPNWLYGLPLFSKLYLHIDRYFYRRQWGKSISVERIYFCKKTD